MQSLDRERMERKRKRKKLGIESLVDSWVAPVIVRVHEVGFSVFNAGSGEKQMKDSTTTYLMQSLDRESEEEEEEATCWIINRLNLGHNEE